MLPYSAPGQGIGQVYEERFCTAMAATSNDMKDLHIQADCTP